MSESTAPPLPASAPRPAEPAAPTTAAERILAPDLARGMMLLLIVLAHVPWFLYTAPTGAAMLHPVGGGLADRIVQALTLIVVDARTHTMFGFLFAYGIGQMAARQAARGAGPADVRRLLRRRHWWMLAFGAVHAALLWQGDIIGTYGLIGLIMVGLLLHRSDRTIMIWLGALLGAAAVVCAVSVAAAYAAPAGEAFSAADMQRLSIAEPAFLASALVRFPTWVFTMFSGVVSFALPAAFMMGLLAARHRVLEEPQRHLKLLRRTAVLGIGAGWAAGIAVALQHTGAAEIAPDGALTAVHFFTGIFTGAGYAALFGLIAHRIARRGSAGRLPVRALSALGRRSLSGYLAQSVLLWPLLAAWGLGLGAHLSSWSAAALGIAAWLATVAIAFALDRAGLRGPAEVLLRRLTYRPAPRTGPTP